MSDFLNTECDHEIGAGPEFIPQIKLILEPLVIPEIVREIMKFIEPKDLSKYRLICRTWNQEIIRQIKDRFTFDFNSVQQIDEFIQNGQIFFGFRNLKLKCMSLDISVCVRLISSHGKLLRRLHLDHEPMDYWLRSTMRDPYYIQTQEFYTQLLRIAPNLKELHLTSTFYEARHGYSVHNFVGALMSVNPPNLKGLYFHCKIPVEWAKEFSTRLTSNIHTLVFDDLNSWFALKFDSTSSTGNRIEITRTGVFDIPGLKNYFERKVEAECETGVSIRQLLQTFLSAWTQVYESERGEGFDEQYLG